jgi:A/G-specific adenine glycosylase
MLQQTRVAAVIGHYQRFLERFPAVEALAAAQESSVLAAWSGLGYYRRARQLHAAAKEIVEVHAGRFPSTALAWRALPGVGRYTSAAVASIAYGERVAVVDGNVERVLERLLGRLLGRQQVWSVAEQLLSRSRPGDFNQALMELGATVCLPAGPHCGRCPLLELCATQGELKGPARRQARTKHDIHYALAIRRGAVFFVQRPAHSSWMAGMWELPEVPGYAVDGRALITLRHSITVHDYRVQVRHSPAPAGVAGRWTARSQIHTLPLTGLTRKILRAAKILPPPDGAAGS